MKASEIAQKKGIDPFTREDFDYVGSKVATDPTRLVLVGGQSLEVWGKLYGVPYPPGDSVLSTEDADWLGSKRDAQWLCDQLPDSELTCTSLDDHSPNTAIAYVPRPGSRVLFMDFLSLVYGLNESEVQRLAVEVTLDGHSIKVLHPLLCLESRFANLTGIPSKRTANGLAQAQWAISIVSAYLESLLKDTGIAPRQVVRACHRIAALAESKFGRYCFLEFNLDPLVSVPATLPTRIGGMFESRDWPNTTERIDKKRAKWTAHRKRTKQA